MPSWWMAAILFLSGFFGRDLVWALRWRPGPEPEPGPYDWRSDVGLLNVWAREEEGELVAVVPQSWVAEAEERRVKTCVFCGGSDHPAECGLPIEEAQ